MPATPTPASLKASARSGSRRAACLEHGIELSRALVANVARCDAWQANEGMFVHSFARAATSVGRSPLLCSVSPQLQSWTTA